MKYLRSTAFVIAHFDYEGRIHKSLWLLLMYLSEVGAYLVVISTNLTAEDLSRLQSIARVTVRENIGFDFWSYKLGIESLGDITLWKRVVLCNSSFIVRDPQVLCERFFARSGEFDLLGLTRCGQIGPHLQSYWVCFDNPDILKAQAFRTWWGSLVPFASKDDVIRHQEIGMSAHFEANGFRLGAAFELDRQLKFIASLRAMECGKLRLHLPESGMFSFDPELGEKLDPTQFSWEAVFERFGLLKISLLRINPGRVNLAALPDILGVDAALKELVLDIL